MKRSIPWILLLLSYIAAFAANVGSFAWSYEPQWKEYLTGVLYVSAWGVFWFTGRKDRNKMRFSAIVGAVMAVGGAAGVLVRTFPGGRLTILALLTAGPTVTPLYGLLSAVHNYDIFYLAAAVLGAAWSAGSMLCYCKNRKHEKETT